MRLVQAVAAEGAGAAFAGFVVGACPASVRPASRWASGGSGSWSSLALAAGLGLPVFVFWCGSGPPALPAAWGAWSLVAAGPFSGAWCLSPSPPAQQLPLF